ENIGEKNYYDGGKGDDTLQLTLTRQQFDDAKAEIEAFQAFLADGGKVFHFESFGLTVRGFENLKIETVGGRNTAPVANPDLGVLVSEDDVDFSIDVLANDTDADGNALTLVTAVVTDGFGTAAIVGNQVVYNPGDAYQFLGAGAFENVRIDYTISDGEAEASSFVEIQVNGVNDAPRALSASINTTAAVDGRISVAVVGVSASTSTHGQAAGQLADSIFKAVAVDLADATDWTAASLALTGHEVVVLGGSTGRFDYGSGTTGLFDSLNDFVSKGGGVVTTGFFAFQLRNMEGTAKTSADNITPIAPVWNDEFGVAGAQITVNDPNHPIVRNLSWSTEDPH
ncbi:MAG: Ig-like domain-containing protein, partial [bacterium]